MAKTGVQIHAVRCVNDDERNDVLVPNQLVKLLRSKYLVKAVPFNKIKGLPLRSEEIEDAIDSILGGTNA